jgi:hypothetical protein
MKQLCGDDEGWVWVKHAAIIEDLPCLEVQSTKSISRKLQKLVDLGVLEKQVIKGRGTWTYYRQNQEMIEYLEGNSGQNVLTEDKMSSHEETKCPVDRGHFVQPKTVIPIDTTATTTSGGGGGVTEKDTVILELDIPPILREDYKGLCRIMQRHPSVTSENIKAIQEELDDVAREKLTYQLGDHGPVGVFKFRLDNLNSIVPRDFAAEDMQKRMENARKPLPEEQLAIVREDILRYLAWCDTTLASRAWEAMFENNVGHYTDPLTAVLSLLAANRGNESLVPRFSPEARVQWLSAPPNVKFIYTELLPEGVSRFAEILSVAK